MGSVDWRELRRKAGYDARPSCKHGVCQVAQLYFSLFSVHLLTARPSGIMVG